MEAKENPGTPEQVKDVFKKLDYEDSNSEDSSEHG